MLSFLIKKIIFINYFIIFYYLYQSFIVLLFKGEYINGMRNGKGIEYDNGELIYEGNYLDGKRNGKGKEYKNGELIFEGDFLNGKGIG